MNIKCNTFSILIYLESIEGGIIVVLDHFISIYINLLVIKILGSKVSYQK